MTRAAGAHTGRDAGSTTGVATAVLALLSAGTLATLGVVTAGELRELGRPGGVPGSSDGVQEPVVPTLAPSAEPGGGPGGGSTGDGPRGGPGAGVESLPDALAGGGSGGGLPGLFGTGSPAAPVEPAPPAATPAPGTPVTPVGPVLTGVDPTPTPSTSVLATKKGRHLGQLKARPATAVKAEKAATTGPRGRAVGYRHGPGQPAVTPVGPLVLPTPWATPGDDRRGPGRAQKGAGHGKGHGPAAVPVPYAPVGASPPTVAATDGPGQGNGQAKGHDKH